jgi:maleate isomerase
MSVQYAPKGLIGLLTPQANTTAEIEFAALMPRGIEPRGGGAHAPRATNTGEPADRIF